LEQPQTLPAPEPEAGQPQTTMTRESSLFREIVETLLLTVVIFVLVNTITGRYRIDGSSMEPNLHDSEYVIVNRITYRLLVPIGIGHAPAGGEYVDIMGITFRRLSPPQRGDVIVFQREGTREFIKRVIGLPGDTVAVQGGHVLVNGIALDEPYIAQPNAYTMEPRRIGPNEYFVLGDNRNNSSDSHSWGTVPLNTIDGKAWVTYWPPKDWGVVPHFSYAQAKTP
jgi:signal peptidase I